MTVVQDRLPPDRATTTLIELTRDLQAQEETIRQGTGEAGRRRQEQLGRLTVRQRLGELLDEGAPFWNWGSGRPGRCIPTGATCRPPGL